MEPFILTFANNRGAAAAENVTSAIIEGYHAIRLTGDGPISRKANTEARLELRFGTGEYIIDHSILMRTNVVVTGQGTGKTRLRFSRTFNEVYRTAGDGHAHCYEWDDAFLSVQGLKGREVTVEISDLTMEMDAGAVAADHELILVKVGHGKRVTFRNVVSRYDNCMAHNLDLRVCSNVTVERCRFTAYNNLQQGAIMALRGNTENVTIRDNEFHKHGNDEVITFFGYADDLNDNRTVTIDGRKASLTVIPQTNFKRNILVERNIIHYDSAATAGAMAPGAVHKIDVVVSLYDFDFIIFPSDDLARDHDRHRITAEISNVVIRGNTFEAHDAPVGTWIGLSFSSYATHEGVVIEGNHFTQGRWRRPRGVEPLEYRSNLNINDNSFRSGPIAIRDNTLINDDVSWVTYDGGANYETRYSFINAHGGNLIVEGNRVIDKARGEHYIGMTLLEMVASTTRYGDRDFLGKNQGVGLTASLKGNHIEGILRLAFFAHVTRSRIDLRLSDNYVAGGTYVELQDVAHLDLTMVGNELHATGAQLLFRGSPRHGRLILRGNTSYNERPDASQQPLFTNYDWQHDRHLPITLDHVEIRDNALHGLTPSSLDDTLDDILPTACPRLITRNTF